MESKMHKLIFIVLFCLFLSSCNFVNTKLTKQEFLEKKSTVKIGVGIDQDYHTGLGIYYFKSGLGDKNYYSGPREVEKDGKDYLFLSEDEFFSISSQWTQYLQNIHFAKFTQIKQDMVEKLKEQGFDAKVIPYNIRPKWKSKVVYDVTSVAQKEDIDILIFLRTGASGVLNDYDKEGKLKNSYAFFDVYGEMLYMKKGKMLGGWASKLWDDSFAQRKNIVPINGDWNQPPDYPKVTEALNQAMDNAREYLLNSFFQNAPMSE